MAPEILQLLLLLLSLGNSGRPGRTWAKLQPQEVILRSPGSCGQEDQAEEVHRRLEGETFSVSFSYKPPEHEKIWISWCKKQENGDSCGVTGFETNSSFELLGKKCFSCYDNNSGVLTIWMSELRVNDSGVYECVIQEKMPKRVPRRFCLVVSPGQMQSPSERIQNTSDITSQNQETKRTSILPTSPPVESSSEMKFLILGVVLSCLLLAVFLVVGIVCVRRIYQKAGKGDASEPQGEKSKGSAMKLDGDEDAEDVCYATVSDRSPREPTNAKTHTSVESVEYATITKN